MHCLAVFREDLQTGRIFNADAPASAGYTPEQIQAAYGLKAASATRGSGQTVALIEIGDNPTALSDLAHYRSTFGLACGKCTQRKVSQKGSSSSFPPVIRQTLGESSLDVDVVAAICPRCNILIVEAYPAQTLAGIAANFGAAVDEAVRLGAGYVSMSYGWGRELDAAESHYAHPGVVLVAASGDSGFSLGQPSQPCTYATIVCVGGTSLEPSANARGYTETVWNSGTTTIGGYDRPWATGSSCSNLVSKPSWQRDPGCSHRTSNDIAFSADPNYGIYIYNSLLGGFGPGGGTSAASPAVAALFALAGHSAAGESAASRFWIARGSRLHSILKGNDDDSGFATCSPSYLCTAGTGTYGTYSGPAGWGTPDGLAAF